MRRLDLQSKNIKSLSELLTKSWFKYDKAVTAVIRTMGFNSVKQYTDSNQKSKNYYRVIKQLKSKPAEGTAGILSSVKEVVNSRQFKSLLWIENNVQKYQLQKKGTDVLNQIAKQIRTTFDNLKQIPGIKNVEYRYIHNINHEGNNVVGDKNIYKIQLYIYYDPTIKYIPKNTNDRPFNIKLNTNSILQTIEIPIVDIDLELLYKNQFDTILSSMITEDVLSSSFKFSGACMFTTGNRGGSNSPVSGCLGDRSEEFREITKEGNLTRYISFISTWATVYNQGLANPYRNPGNLMQEYKVKRFTVNTPTSMMKESYCAVPEVRRGNRTGYLRSSEIEALRQGCRSCVFTECKKTMDLESVHHHAYKQNNSEIIPDSEKIELIDRDYLMFKSLLSRILKAHPTFFDCINNGWYSDEGLLYELRHLYRCRKEVDTMTSMHVSMIDTLIKMDAKYIINWKDHELFYIDESDPTNMTNEEEE